MSHRLLLSLGLAALSLQVTCASGEELSKKTLTILSTVQAAVHASPDILLQKQVVESGKGKVREEDGAFDTSLGANARSYTNRTILTEAERQSQNGLAGFRQRQSGYSAALGKRLYTGQSVTLGVAVDRLDDDFINPTSPTRSEVRFSFVQPLLRGRGRDAASAALSAATLEESALGFDLRRTISQKVASAGTAYWSYLSAEQTLQILKVTEERAAKRHEDMKKLVDGGELPKTTLEQSAADLAAKTANRIRGEVDLYSSRQLLGIEMGIPYEQIPQLALPGEEFPQSSTKQLLAATLLPATLDAILNNRNDYQAALLRVDAAQKVRTLAKNGALPKLDLEVGSGYQGLQETDRFDGYFGSLSENSRGATVLVSLSYEFPFANNAARGLLAQANAALQQRSIERDEIRRRVQSEVAVAVTNLVGSWSAYERTTEAVERFRNALDNEMKKFRLQMSTLLNVQQVEDQLTQVLLDQINTSTTFATALLTLRLATDTLVGFTDSAGVINEENLLSVPSFLVSEMSTEGASQ